ncbi:MAG TPA: hypothetical protein EYQ80_05660 [Candidatus Poseidoniales archaeon]|nr:hypothetical protein [Candidatus Poseidoniales archaeon]
MQECDACGLLFGGSEECPSCGSRVSHVAPEDVDDGRDGRRAGPLPGESALDSALDGIAGLELSPTEPATTPGSGLPFQMGGKGETVSTLPFGIGAPAGVLIESKDDLASPESEPPVESIAGDPAADTDSPVSHAGAAPAATTDISPSDAVSYLTPQDLPSDSLQSAQPGLLSPPPASSPELENAWAMHQGADSPVLEATAEAVAIAEMPAIATAETTGAAAAQAAGDDLILLQARTISVPEEDQQLAREPVLVENEYQIKAAPLDTSHVYSTEQDVVFHDFGDELQVSEVYVDFDELVDPAEQTVRFNPEMLTEGEPELMPARALPIDDAGDVAVAGATIAGFEALGEGRWEDATGHFREVCNARPGDAAALNDFGLALLQQAIVVHEANPTSTPAEEPHFEAAVLALRQAAQQDKHDATIIYNLGTCLASCGRHGVASRIWDAAMTLAPSDAAPINGKAVSLIALGEFDTAASLLMRARDASPAEPVILRNLRRLRPTA